MKVAHRSENRLVLIDRPWHWAAIVVLSGLLFLGIGIAFLALAISDGASLSGGWAMTGIGLATLVFGRFLVRTSRFEFDREKQIVSITRIGPRGTSEQWVALGDVTKATVLSWGTRKAGAMMLKLRHPYEPVFFTHHRTSGPGPGQMAAAVNDWLKLKPIAKIDPDQPNPEADEPEVKVIGTAG